jgi:hypothetical protein
MCMHPENENSWASILSKEKSKNYMDQDQENMEAPQYPAWEVAAAQVTDGATALPYMSWREAKQR